MARSPSIPAASSPSDKGGVDRPASLRGLIAAIITQHHEYLKRELPSIEALLAEGQRAESEVLRQTTAALIPIFLRFRMELEGHMKREEVTLFPLIEGLERAVSSGQPAPRNSFGPLSNALQFMHEDHDFENELLGRMAEISRGFATPPEAPPQYQVLMRRLQALQSDLEEHVRKEDEILFPAAIRLEESAH